LGIYYNEKEKELLDKSAAVIAAKNEPVRDWKTTYWGELFEIYSFMYFLGFVGVKNIHPWGLGSE
jgi:hypothetical protein